MYLPPLSEEELLSLESLLSRSRRPSGLPLCRVYRLAMMNNYNLSISKHMDRIQYVKTRLSRRTQLPLFQIGNTLNTSMFTIMRYQFFYVWFLREIEVNSANLTNKWKRHSRGAPHYGSTIHTHSQAERTIQNSKYPLLGFYIETTMTTSIVVVDHIIS